DLADILIRKSGFVWWPPQDYRRQFGSLAEFRKQPYQRFIRSDRPHEQARGVSYPPGGIMAPGVSSSEPPAYNIIVSRGDVRTGGKLGQSIVYANGDITVGFNLPTVIIVCDGDVTVERDAADALVVARGSIQVKGHAASSTLVAGGAIKVGDWTVKP